MSGWLSPTNKILWIKAFRSKAPQVKLDDGRKFNIEYHGDKALVRPANKELVPMGWFELAKVTHPDWLDVP